jgi:hypothetical protein
VDWVARAIVRLVGRPPCHGGTYHLVARERPPVRVLKEVAESVMKLDGVECSGPGRPADATSLESAFLGQLEDYWPYLDGDPAFDDRNTRAALAALPPPCLDRATLARLIRFAIADRWGRARKAQTAGPLRIDCAHYVEEFFPAAARRSVLVRIPLTATVGLDIRGPGGGRWVCRWHSGALTAVHRGPAPSADVVYRMNVKTFATVVRGLLPPQEAFFQRRIEIEGDMEKGLKLAVLFEQFVREFPLDPDPDAEAADVLAV